MENLICAKCNQQIAEADLVECPHCWEIYHRECWENTPNCVSCKKFNRDYAEIQVEKAAEKELEEKSYEAVENEENHEENNNTFEFTGKEMTSSPVANTIMSISNVILIIGVVIGVLFAGYMLFLNGVIGAIIGIVVGGAVAAMGWVVSILVNGFAELINNSQKNVYYLSKLVEKSENDKE